MKNKTGAKKGTDDPKALENCDGNVDSSCFWVVCPFFTAIFAHISCTLLA